MDNRPPPKFKVGDKVKLKDITANRWLKDRWGNVYVVTEVSPVLEPHIPEGMYEIAHWYVEILGGVHWFENRVKLAYPTTPIPLEDLI